MVVRRDPRAFGIESSRWTLAKIHEVCDWLRVGTMGGVCQLLQRLGISWKLGREHVHSPDPDYRSKLHVIGLLTSLGQSPDKGIVTLFLDELTCYRQPSLAQGYEIRGHRQPLAERSHRSNTATRILASLDVRDGRVLYKQSGRIGIKELVSFFQKLHGYYDETDRIYVVSDNWPVHFHPDVLVALEEQESPWPIYRPQQWSQEPSPKAREQWGDLKLHIQLVPLPTYASWANPIEKLWRWLKQEVIHLHRMADHFDRLKAEIARFLDRFQDSSPDLLRYTGLPVPS